MTTMEVREQAMFALGRANDIRVTIAEERRRVGRMSRADGLEAVAAIIEANEHPLSAAKVRHLLLAVKWVGGQKADAYLAIIRAGESRRLRDLTPRQVAALVRALRADARRLR